MATTCCATSSAARCRARPERGGHDDHAARCAAAHDRAPRDLPRRDGRVDAPDHERRSVADDGRGDPDRPAREEGNDRRDHRSGARDARARGAGRCRRSGAFRGHRRYRRRRCEHVQHLDRVDVRRRRGRCDGRQARQPQRLVEIRQRRRAGGARRGDRPDAGRGGREHPSYRDRFHVRAEPPSGDAQCRGRAQGTRRAHAVQHPGPADQSGWRTEHLDGRVPSRPRRDPGPRAATTRHAARARRLGSGRHGRDLARRGDDGRRAARRRGARVRHRTGGFRPFDGVEPQSPCRRCAGIARDGAGGAGRSRRHRARHRLAQCGSRASRRRHRRLDRRGHRARTGHAVQRRGAREAGRVRRRDAGDPRSASGA